MLKYKLAARDAVEISIGGGYGYAEAETIGDIVLQSRIKIELATTEDIRRRCASAAEQAAGTLPPFAGHQASPASPNSVKEVRPK